MNTPVHLAGSVALDSPEEVAERGISRGWHPDLAAEFLRVYTAAAEAGPAGARS